MEPVECTRATVEGNLFLPIPTPRTIGTVSLKKSAEHILNEREKLLSDVPRTGGWLLADGSKIGRRSLNNSVLLSLNGIFFKDRLNL